MRVVRSLWRAKFYLTYWFSCNIYSGNKLFCEVVARTEPVRKSGHRANHCLLLWGPLGNPR